MPSSKIPDLSEDSTDAILVWIYPDLGGCIYTCASMDLLKINRLETVLAVQWLRLCTPSAGGLGLIPGGGTRSHIPLQGDVDQRGPAPS